MKIAVLLLTLSQAAASAGVILSVTGPSGPNTIGIFPFNTVAIPFTVAQPYSGVTISPDLIGSFSGIAYLTNQIGPGTTAANQIASSAFTSASNFLGSFQAVLQNVSLPKAGTYYLVLTATQTNPPQGVQETNAPAIVADVGASIGGLLSGPSGGYPPAVILSLVNNGSAPEVVITGIAASVPEPATWGLLGLGLGGLVVRRRRLRDWS